MSGSLAQEGEANGQGCDCFHDEGMNFEDIFTTMGRAITLACQQTAVEIETRERIILYLSLHPISFH